MQTNLADRGWSVSDPNPETHQSPFSNWRPGSDVKDAPRKGLERSGGCYGLQRRFTPVLNREYRHKVMAMMCDDGPRSER